MILDTVLYAHTHLTLQDIDIPSVAGLCAMSNNTFTATPGVDHTLSVMKPAQKRITFPLSYAAWIAALAVSSSVFALEPQRVPSHCGKGEYAYLNAHMSEVRRPPEGGYKLIKTGKLLSICTDSKSEPFRMVVYRFGPVGKVEMERVASEFKKFFIFERSTSPHTGENIFFFRAGSYTYCVSEATAQGSGIGLSVLKSGRQVLDLFSGNERGEDFESEMIEVNFSSPQSRVFQSFRSSNPFQTPCDPTSRK